MINLELLVIALVICKAVDWIIQTKYQSINKTKDRVALLTHAATYGILSTILISFFTPVASPLILISLLITTHIIIDDRKIVKLLMRFKGMTPEEVIDKRYLGIQIGIDQRLHEVVLVVIATII